MNGASMASFRAAAEPEDWEPPPQGTPSRCCRCGRFVSGATIVYVPSDQSTHGDSETGVCKIHGRVEVT